MVGLALLIAERMVSAIRTGHCGKYWLVDLLAKLNSYLILDFLMTLRLTAWTHPVPPEATTRTRERLRH